jgi:hypothetical protein
MIMMRRLPTGHGTEGAVEIMAAAAARAAAGGVSGATAATGGASAARGAEAANGDRAAEAAAASGDASGAVTAGIGLMATGVGVFQGYSRIFRPLLLKHRNGFPRAERTMETTVARTGQMLRPNNPITR